MAKGGVFMREAEEQPVQGSSLPGTKASPLGLALYTSLTKAPVKGLRGRQQESKGPVPKSTRFLRASVNVDAWKHIQFSEPYGLPAICPM